MLSEILICKISEKVFSYINLLLETQIYNISLKSEHGGVGNCYINTNICYPSIWVTFGIFGQCQYLVQFYILY